LPVPGVGSSCDKWPNYCSPAIVTMRSSVPIGALAFALVLNPPGGVRVCVLTSGPAFCILRARVFPRSLLTPIWQRMARAQGLRGSSPTTGAVSLVRPASQTCKSDHHPGIWALVWAPWPSPHAYPTSKTPGPAGKGRGHCTLLCPRLRPSHHHGGCTRRRGEVSSGQVGSPAASTPEAERGQPTGQLTGQLVE